MDIKSFFGNGQVANMNTPPTPPPTPPPTIPTTPNRKLSLRLGEHILDPADLPEPESEQTLSHRRHVQATALLATEATRRQELLADSARRSQGGIMITSKPTPTPTPKPPPKPTLNFDYVVALSRSYTIPTSPTLALPINKIDGVKCYVSLSHAKTWRNYTLKPQPEEDKVDYVRMDITVYNSDNYELPRDAYNQAEFEEMIDTLKNYRFDKVQNRFIDIRKRALNTIEFYDCLKTESISFDDECCVCLEVTSGTIRNCKHPICMKCASNLVKPNCPLCRERICCESDGSWDPTEEDE
jgi:hypothetical protein